MFLPATKSTSLALLTLGWLALFGALLPEAPRDVRAQERASLSSSIDARARWESMSSEDRTRLQKRFERLQQLDADQRADLTQRAQRWKRQEERVLRRLSDKDRSRLMQHPPRKRQELIEEMVRSERRDEGLRLEAKLPEKTREWLAKAPPEQRRKRLEQFKRDTRERISARAVSELVSALGMGGKEIRRLERLPLEERMSHVLRLRKELATKQLAASGLPQGFTRERWEALEALPPEEYFIEFLRLRREGLIEDLPPVGRAKEREGRPARVRKRALSRDLRRGLHVSPEELLELAELPDDERRTELDRRRRTRVVAVLRRHEALSEEQIAALADLSDLELFARVRAVVHEAKPEEQPPPDSESSDD